MAAQSTDNEARKEYEDLVKEEIPIQKTNLPLNGGLPSCITLLDNFLLCFGTSISAVNDVPVGDRADMCHLLRTVY